MPHGRHLGMFSSNGVTQGSVLVDGFVRAMWKPSTQQGAATVVVTPFVKPLPKGEQRPIADEAMKLLGFLAPGAKHEVRFAKPAP